MTVREQMRLDEEFKQKVAGLKKAEADRAFAEVQKWTSEGEMVDGQTISHVAVPTQINGGRKMDNVTNKAGGLHVAQRLVNSGVRGYQRKTKSMLSFL